MAILQSVSLTSIGIMILSLTGSFGLAIGGIRALAVLVNGSDNVKWRISEPKIVVVYLLLGLLGILLLGLVPQLFFREFARLPVTFGQPLP
jgi:hypothetical protein